MTDSLKASTEGLTIIDQARKRRGWTKTSTACWWQDAHTSRATLRRFWRGERIQKEAFIGICQAVGVSNWEAITQSAESLITNVPELNSPLIDWNEAPDIEHFYGRTQELNQLEQWMTTDNCQLVVIMGMGGIGKTALALALTDRIQSQFECIIWRSLVHDSSLANLLDSLLNAFEQKTLKNVMRSIAKLIELLEKRRCLLILDGLDVVWHRVKDRKKYREYNAFLRALSFHNQSCILITSSEPLPKWEEIVARSQQVRCLTLQGLPPAEALMLLQAGGFTGKEPGLKALSKLYRGNPLALKTITPLIKSLFGGDVKKFLFQNTLVVGDRLQVLLTEQFNRLSESERSIVYWLAIWQEPISLYRLQTHWLNLSDPSVIWQGIAALESRWLLEKHFSTDEPSFTLQPMVMKVVTEKLVKQAQQEISKVEQTGDIQHFKLLRTHWLLRPGTDDIAGDLILSQLQEQLWLKYGSALPQTLSEIFPLLKEQPPLVVGYINCNLVALFNKIV
ncbi:MAG: NACHT domain-containing protein [Symploca sp. SIO2D2]|nr:NACHT domain-containing protein [Symploca sp. SIO2D2]